MSDATGPGRSLDVVNSWDEIPEFPSEREEAEFWNTHALGDALLAEMKPAPEGLLPAPRPRR